MIDDILYELSIRVLVILDSIGSASSNRIAAYDFISTCGYTFGVSDYDLIETGQIKSQVYLGRLTLLDDAILYQVSKGNVDPVFSQDGIRYNLSVAGKQYVNDLNDVFCDKMHDACLAVSECYGNRSDQELSDLIGERIR